MVPIMQQSDESPRTTARRPHQHHVLPSLVKNKFVIQMAKLSLFRLLFYLCKKNTFSAATTQDLVPLYVTNFDLIARSLQGVKFRFSSVIYFCFKREDIFMIVITRYILTCMYCIVIHIVSADSKIVSNFDSRIEHAL